MDTAKESNPERTFRIAKTCLPERYLHTLLHICSSSENHSTRMSCYDLRITNLDSAAWRSLLQQEVSNGGPPSSLLFDRLSFSSAQVATRILMMFSSIRIDYKKASDSGN